MRTSYLSEQWRLVHTILTQFYLMCVQMPRIHVSFQMGLLFSFIWTLVALKPLNLSFVQMARDRVSPQLALSFSFIRTLFALKPHVRMVRIDVLL